MTQGTPLLPAGPLVSFSNQTKPSWLFRKFLPSKRFFCAWNGIISEIIGFRSRCFS